MKAIVTITDITRMAPPFICLAGVTDDRRGVRIQFKNRRIDEAWLVQNGAVVIRPFARVKMSLIQPKPEPPHTEDWVVDPNKIENCGFIKPADRSSFLASICQPSVAAVFDTEIYQEPGFYVLKGSGSRSLGAIRTGQILGLAYRCTEKGWDCHVKFQDTAGDQYFLKVKDLSFCAYLDFLREKENLPCDKIEKKLTQELRESECYLRVGLARGWAQHPERCFLQITGVYSFPDILEGRWFADFCTPQSYQGWTAAHPDALVSLPSVTKSRSVEPPCEPIKITEKEWNELLTDIEQGFRNDAKAASSPEKPSTPPVSQPRELKWKARIKRMMGLPDSNSAPGDD